eukprot:scaffold18122_cov194-Amphora_coffeaeformis.AAC.3
MMKAVQRAVGRCAILRKVATTTTRRGVVTLLTTTTTHEEFFSYRAAFLGAGGLAAFATATAATAQCEEAPGTATSSNNNDDPSSYTEVPNPVWPAGISDADMDALVDDCLRDPSINIATIPDYLEHIVERQLYKNCLTIIFRLLDMMAATFTITCCGHDLRISVEPSKNPVFTDSAVQQATKIDPDLMLQVARRMGVQPEKEVNQHRSWWDRWIRGTQDEVLAQLHATLYSLVLGILDDVLEHTKITMLSDTLQFDLVPVPLEVQEAKKAQALKTALSEIKDDDEKEDVPHEESSAALPFATFTAGLGIGLTLMSVLGKR